MEQSPARTRKHGAKRVGVPTWLKAGQVSLFLGFILGLSFRSIWNSLVAVVPESYTNEVASAFATAPEFEKKNKKRSKLCTVEHKPFGECPGDLSCFIPAAKELVAEGFGTIVEVGAAFLGQDAFEIDRQIGGGEGTGTLRRVFSFEASSKNFRTSVMCYPPYNYPRIQFVQAVVTDQNEEFLPYFVDGSGVCLECDIDLDPYDENHTRIEYVPGIRLQDSIPLRRKPGLVDVGAVRIALDYNANHAVTGMMEWLQNDEIAPPFVEFKFDVCLMLSNNRTSRADIVHMLESLMDAGYSLEDGSVSRYESLYYALVQTQLTSVSFDTFMRWKEKLDGNESPEDPNPVDVDTIDHDLVRHVEAAHATYVNGRPKDCRALVDWYCPPDRPWNAKRTYTTIMARKIPERRRQRFNTTQEE